MSSKSKGGADARSPFGVQGDRGPHPVHGWSKPAQPPIPEQFVPEIIRIAKSVAGKYSRSPWARAMSVSFDDLAQVAMIGAMTSLRTWVPGKGAKRTTWEYHGAKGAVTHYLRDQAAIMRIPRPNYDNKVIEPQALIQSLDEPVRRDGPDGQEYDLSAADVVRDPRPPIDLGNVEVLDVLRHALSEQDRKVIFCLWYGWSPVQTAERLRIEQPDVGAAVERARKALEKWA